MGRSRLANEKVTARDAASNGAADERAPGDVNTRHRGGGMSTPKPDPAQLLAGLFQTGGDMIRAFWGTGRSAGGKLDPAEHFIAASRQFAAMQQDLITQMTGYWSGMMGIAALEQEPGTSGPKHNDRRSAGEAWTNDPRFDLQKRTYPAYSI